MKTPAFVSDFRDFLAFSVTKRSLLRLVLFLLILIILAVVLTATLRYFHSAISGLSRYGYLGIFLITLVSSFTVILPFPGTALWLSMVSEFGLNLVWASIAASIGGTLGELTSYYAGYGGRAVIASKDSQTYQAVEGWMKRRGGWAIFLFALFPFLIFDIVGIVAGVLRYPLRRFIIFCWLGRLPRSFIEAYTGVTLIEFILPHLPEWMNFAR